MAADVAPPTAPESGLMATIRGIPAFYRSVVAEMRKVTWPEVADVRRATIAIIIFVLLLGLFIYLIDALLGYVLVTLIPSLFTGR
jgi:preprotein translocase SecE subunit